MSIKTYEFKINDGKYKVINDVSRKIDSGLFYLAEIDKTFLLKSGEKQNVSIDGITAIDSYNILKAISDEGYEYQVISGPAIVPTVTELSPSTSEVASTTESTPEPTPSTPIA